MNAFDNREKSSLALDGLGETKEKALIVIVPSISDYSINKRRRINDGSEKWLSEFHKSQIASHDLPPLENLKNLSKLNCMLRLLFP